MGQFMRVGTEVVEVARTPDIAGGKGSEKGRAGCGGRKRSGQIKRDPIDHNAKPGQKQEIDNHQRLELHPEKAEDQRVEVHRQRTVEVSKIAVEDLSLGDLPRQVELSSEIDEGIRPRSPRRGHRVQPDPHHRRGTQCGHKKSRYG